MPNIGDTCKGTDIGRKSSQKYIWTACIDCHEERWTGALHGEPQSHRCLSCSVKYTHMKQRENFKWELFTGTPYLGQEVYGRELGYTKDAKHKYKWSECPYCHKTRWIVYRGTKYKYTFRCITCAGKSNAGDKHHHWKGGSHITNGYRAVKVTKEDEFYISMANKNGYVMEHRLIMAKYLHRCLLPWEVVHHKNGDKLDNRIENLELLNGRKYHLVDVLSKSKAKRWELELIKLRGDNKLLKNENKYLKEQIKNLTR